MPTTPLAIMPAPVLPAWVAIRDMLLTDPTLKRLRIDWRLPEDESFNDEPADERITVKLTPKVTGSQREAVRFPQTVRSYVLTIQVDAMVPSPLWDDMANLAGAIEAALDLRNSQRPDRVAQERAYGEAGILDHEVELPVDWDQPGRIVVTVWRTV